MGVVDLGSVLRLHNDSVVVVVAIVTGGTLGTFYTVIEGEKVREICEDEIREVIDHER